MYFICSGICDVTLASAPGKVVAQLLKAGHFGEIALLVPDSLRTATVYASTNWYEWVLLSRDILSVLFSSYTACTYHSGYH